MRNSADDFYGAADDVALDLKGILGAVGRRWFRILFVTLLVGAGTFAGLSLMSPRYMAETRVLVEDRDINLGPVQPNGTGAGITDQESVQSQVQLLTSRDLIRRVAEKNKLADLPEFDGSKIGMVDALLQMLGLGRDPLRVSPEERVIDIFLEKLLAFRSEGSRVLVIQFTSTDRELAAKVANSLAEEYLRMQSEAKQQTSKDQTTWLGEEIAKLQVKVRDAESAVEKYRAGSDLFVGENNASVARQQISDINNSIAAARADQASAESKAKQLRDLLRKNASLETATNVIDSENFRALRNRESGLRTKLSELSVAMLPGHPEIKAIQSQIEDIVRQQVAEARRVLAAFENDAQVAAARVQTLQDNLGQLKVTSSQDNQSGVELRALEREATTQRTLLEGMMARYREANAVQSADTIPADARVISRATVPNKASFPKVVPYTIVAMLATLLMMIAWTIAMEFMSGRALTPVSAPPTQPRPVRAPALRAVRGDHLDDETDGVEAVARPAPGRVFETKAAPATRVERFRSRIGKSEPVEREAAADVAAGPVEEMGAASELPVMEAPELCEALAEAGAARVAVVMVGESDEGLDTLDAFARFASEDGLRLVLVETVGGDEAEAGLVDLIEGEADFSEIIRRNPATRAHVIPVGTAPLSREMLMGDGLATALDALEEAYDLVLIDLGALSADPGRFQILADADHVVLVGVLDDPDVEAAVEMLAQSGITDLTVLPVNEDSLHRVA